MTLIDITSEFVPDVQIDRSNNAVIVTLDGEHAMRFRSIPAFEAWVEHFDRSAAHGITRFWMNDDEPLFKEAS